MSEADFRVVSLPELQSSRSWYPQLHRLEPYGLGTPDIEAQSSYIQRLSISHSLMTSSIVNKILRPVERSSALPISMIYTMNGVSPLAESISSSLSRLGAAVDEPEYLTFLPIRNASDKRGHGVSSKTLRWCRQCWAEDLKNLGQVYTRLFWTTPHVSVCPIHEVELQTTCPHCSAQQKMLCPIPYQDLCEKCGYSLLDVNSQHTETTTNFENELWNSRSIRRLIGRINSSKQFVSDSVFVSKLQHIVNLHCGGNRAELCRQIGIESRHINKWFTGHNKPTLTMMLEVCYRLRIPIDSMLFDSFELTSPELWRNPGTAKLVTKIHLSDKRKRAIRSFMRLHIENPETPPIKVSSIAKQFYTTIEVLKYHCKSEYVALKSIFDEWHEKERLNSINQRLERVESFIDQLKTLGLPVSERSLRSLDGFHPSDLRKPEVKELLTKNGAQVHV